jgi:hypothetical protein
MVVKALNGIGSWQGLKGREDKMEPKDASEDRLQQLLQQAYRAGASAPAPVVASPALMRRLRQQAASKEERAPFGALDRLFWRLAPAAGALIAILAMVAVNLDFFPDAAVWSLLSYESEASAMVQILLL